MVSHFLAAPVRFTLSVLKMTATTHLFYTHFFQVAPCTGPSMLPTFSVEGDYLAIDMTARLGRGVTNGDLVMYKIPMDPTALGIKRVVGMPGDYVVLGTPNAKGEEQTIQVPEGHCWIVGDNLTVSRDSRVYGPLPLGLIVGKPIAKVLPLSERHWIESGLQPVSNQR